MDEYKRNLKSLKNLMREELDDIVGRNGKDSTSALTYNLLYSGKTQVEFKFDVGIIYKNINGSYCRLIHNKSHDYFNQDKYIWNEMPNSKGLDKKIDFIKKNGHWNDVRNTYLEKKNMYLALKDYNHPSFKVYIETINEIYAKHTNLLRETNSYYMNALDVRGNRTWITNKSILK